jgi:hypothetical protein
MFPIRITSSGKNLGPTSQGTKPIFVMKLNQLIIFRAIALIYSER